jgi:flagellar basal body-associated protein FliL
MAEEAKQEAKGQDSKKVLATMVKVVIGLALLALGIFWGWVWRQELLMLVKACMGPFAFLAGIITLLIAKE